MSTPIAASSPSPVPLDDNYEALLAAVRGRFADLTTGDDSRARLFTTGATDLFPAFLAALPERLRQENTCAACRRFVERYGHVVRVSDDGRAQSALWDPERTPAPYTDAVRALASLVAKAPIDGVFLSEEVTWGVPKTGEWEHLAVTPSPALVFKPSALQTTSQTAAEKKQDFEALSRGLTEFPIELVRKAQALLSAEALYRSEKVLGVADWLLQLHEARKSAKGAQARENLTWLAAARAPAGFCHVRSTMIGTLLEDLAADRPFDQIKARFAAKMHPLQYMRPTAAPAAGNIAQAEKIIEKLKTAGSLERRFAKLSDLQPLWVPPSSRTSDARDEAGAKKGVFSHLVPGRKGAAADMDLPATTITWEKLAKTVLPRAESIEYLVPAGKLGYMALVTAKNADAPPIVQWDFEDRRNPVTWYFYTGGSAPERWNLKVGVYHPVTAVVLQPTLWDPSKSFSHQGEKVFFLLEGARDLDYKSGCGFFPEFLKSEYHSIRATLEAHVTGAVVSGRDEGDACGIGLSKGAGQWNVTFRITSKGGVRGVYTLDRWD